MTYTTELKYGETENRLVAQAQGPYKDFRFDCVPTLDRERIEPLFTGDFANNGENIVIIAPAAAGKTHLSYLIGGGVASLGKTVRFINGDYFTGWVSDDALCEPEEVFDTERVLRNDLANCDLLIVNETARPYRGYTAAGRDTFGKLLNERARTGRSTLIVSKYTPREWSEFDVFGRDTIKTLAQIHMGVFPSRWVETHASIRKLSMLPLQGEDAVLLESMGRLPLSAFNSPDLVTEYLAVTNPERKWHFFDIKSTTYNWRTRAAN